MDLSKIFKYLWKQTSDLEITMNCILVLDGIRTSWLFEDDEYLKSNGEFYRIIKIINKLGFFHFEDFRGQVLIMKKGTKITFDKNNYTHKELGEFLSYPCAGDIVDGRNYGFHIKMTYKKHTKAIMSMVCKNKANIKIGILLMDLLDLLERLNLKIKMCYQFNKKFTMKQILDTYQKYQQNEIVTINNEMKKEILQNLINHSYEFLVCLYENKIVDIFEKKYTQLMITLMCTCASEYKFNSFHAITNDDDLKNACETETYQKTKFIVKTLQNLYQIIIPKEYIDDFIEKIREDYSQ